MGRSQSFEAGRGHLLLVGAGEPAGLQALAAALSAQHRLLQLDQPDQLEAALGAEPPDLILLQSSWWRTHGGAFGNNLQRLHIDRLPVLLLDEPDPERLQTMLAAGVCDHLEADICPGLALKRVASQLDLEFLRDQLRSHSSQDPLTGLANRVHLDEFLTATYLQARRRHEPIALIMFEIDRLKPFNEEYGYAAGDDVLVLIGRTLSALRRRPLDLFARYGGDQFACVLPNTDIDGARIVADMLKADVASLAIEHRRSDLARHITISIGVAADEPGPHAQPRHLLDAALDALEEAKRHRTVC